MPCTFRIMINYQDDIIIYFFLDSHAQAIASIKAFAHWLSQFYNETHKVNLDKDKFASLVSTLLESIVPMFSKEVQLHYNIL